MSATEATAIPLFRSACLAAMLAVAGHAHALPSLRVAPSGRYLTTEDGRPFVYLADTAWELLHRLSRDEAEVYLKTRADQGFNAIQTVALAELGGLDAPNAYGDTPLVDSDPSRPDVTPGADPRDAAQYDYWDHVDHIVDRAASRGLYLALLPTWGSRWNRGKSSGPEIFTPDNAESYGRWLGERYRSRPIIWVLGGDRDIQSDRHKAIIRAMAKGIAIGVSGREDYSQVLMTFHPRGGRSSAQWFHDDPWLDFNMQQNGHCNDTDVAGRIARDYARHPVKPVLDGEPLYENFSMCFSADRPLSDAYEVRKYAYWSVLSGAFGHAYGNHSVWQMADDRHPPVNGPQQLRHRVANRVLRTAGSPMRVSASLLPWREALHQDGARDMQHLRRLVESRPFTDRVPDGSLAAGSLLTGWERIVAIRDAARSYAFVYSAGGRPVSVHLGRIGGPVRAWWFSPRTGEAHAIGTFPNAGVQAFTPRSQGRGNDWVLVLDDVSKGYGTPGRPR